MKRLLLCFIAALALWSCDEIYSFSLYNNSDAPISICYKYYNDDVERDTLMEYEEMYYLGNPKDGYDTLMLDGNRIIKVDPTGICPPKENYYIDVYSTISPFILFGNNDNNRLDVFIISTDTLKKYGFDEVRKNNRALVRYRFTRMQGLNLGKRNNGPKNLVCYPPTEAMLDYGIDVFIYPEVKNK